MFIELTYSGRPILVSFANIVSVELTGDGKTHIATTKHSFKVDEDFTTVAKILTSITLQEDQNDVIRL